MIETLAPLTRDMIPTAIGLSQFVRILLGCSVALAVPSIISLKRRRSRRLEWENSSDLFAPRHSITEGAVHIIDDIESAMAEASQGQHAIEASLSLYSLEATQSQQAQAHALVLAPASSLKIGMTSADDTVCVLSPSAVLTARTAHCNLAEGQGEGDVSVSQEEEGDDIETLQSIQSVSPLKPAQGGNSDDIESVQGVQDEVRHLARAAVRHMVHTHITTHARTHTHTPLDHSIKNTENMENTP